MVIDEGSQMIRLFGQIMANTDEKISNCINQNVYIKSLSINSDFCFE